MSQTTLPDPPTAGDLSQIQSELLSLLNGPIVAPPPRVSEPIPAPPPPPLPLPSPPVERNVELPVLPPVQSEGCPSCGFTGSWGMGSWCPQCGYFPRLGRQGDAVEPERPADELPPAPWELVSGWIWMLLGGMALIALVSAAMPFCLPNPLHRGACAIVQVSVGLLAAFSAQVRAFVLSMRTGENYQFYSIVTSPVGIWRGARKLLPASRSTFFLAAWGWTAALGAGIFIGVHWPVLLKSFQEYVAESRKAQAALAAGKKPEDAKKDGQEKTPGEMTFGEFVGEVGKTLTPEEEKPKMKFRVKNEESSEDLDELMNDLVSEVPVDMKSEEKQGVDPAAAAAIEGAGAENAEEPPPGQRCLIIGYTANASGEIRSLLVAVPLKDGRLRFAAKLPLDSLTNRDLAELRKVLGKIRTRTPATDCPFGGTWVRPVLQCRVQHDGWIGDGRLKNPRVEELILESINTPSRSAVRPTVVR